MSSASENIDFTGFLHVFLLGGREWEIAFEYKDDQTPVIEVLKEIQNKKTPVVTTDAPKTGDDTNWMLPLLEIFASGICVIYAVSRKRKMRKGTEKKA